MDQKRRIIISIGIFFLLSASLVQAQTEPKKLSNGTVVLETFEDETVGELPSMWYDRDGNKQLPNHDAEEQAGYKYKIRQEHGNKYLHYAGTRARHINLPLINEKKRNIYNINIYDTPILSWKVRAEKLPENANEDYKDRNDSVASIYVVFDMGHVLFKKVPKSIRYTWSSTLKEGTELSKFFGNQKIVVVESGTQKAGQWVTFKRNIVEDYRRLFGDNPPKNPLAILILSDGDSTGSFVEADYDDIKLMPSEDLDNN